MKTLGQLRLIRDEELDLMLSWRNHPSIRANMYTKHEISREEHIAWWRRTSQREDQRYFMYEINTEPFGIVGLNAIDRTNENCSWAFYAAPSAPKGTGSRMEFLALDHVFSELKLHKLYCEVLALNTPVIKLHKKFGFQVEGIFREQHRIAEIRIDVYRLGLLAGEWVLKRAELLDRLTTRP